MYVSFLTTIGKNHRYVQEIIIKKFLHKIFFFFLTTEKQTQSLFPNYFFSDDIIYQEDINKRFFERKIT